MSIEKEIEEELARWYCKRSLPNADWESLPSHVKAQFYDKTKELVDLVALAKKKAREEVMSRLQEAYPAIDTWPIWKALKEGRKLE